MEGGADRHREGGPTGVTTVPVRCLAAARRAAVGALWRAVPACALKVPNAGLLVGEELEDCHNVHDFRPPFRGWSLRDKRIIPRTEPKGKTVN